MSLRPICVESIRVTSESVINTVRGYGDMRDNPSRTLVHRDVLIPA